MRTTISSVLTGLGAFLLLAAGLVHFYAHPQLATTPTNYSTTTHLQAENATILDTRDLAHIKPLTTNLDVVAYTTADSGANRPKGVSVWTNRTVITPSGWTQPFQLTSERIPFGSKSGAAVDCASCTNPHAPGVPGQFIVQAQNGTNVPVPTVFHGQVLKFPFDTQKKNYEQWDDTLGKATQATYVGTAKVDGMTTYKFVQTIPTTHIQAQDQTVPGYLFGVKNASVPAQMMYSNVKTFWVEPTTGTPVDITQDLKQTLVWNGHSVAAMDGTIAYTPHQVQTLVDTTKGKAPLLQGMQVTFPVIFGILGLASLAGGILIRRRGKDAGTPAAFGDRNLVTA